MNDNFTKWVGFGCPRRRGAQEGAAGLCKGCRSTGLCGVQTSLVVSRDEMEDAKLVWLVRRGMHWVSITQDVGPAGVVEWLNNTYRDLKARIVNFDGQDVPLDMSVFEAIDKTIDIGQAKAFYERQDEYFARTFCSPVYPGAVYRVSREYQPRFQVAASIICAYFAPASILWPRSYSSNDNRRSPRAANDNDQR